MSLRTSCSGIVGRDGEIAFLQPDLVAQIARRLDAPGVPPALGRVDVVVALVLVLVVADVVEDEELALRPEIGDLGEARLLQIGLGLAGDIARVARVVLAREGIADVADHHEGLGLEEGVHEGRVRHGLDQHVALVDRLPAADTDPSKPSPFSKASSSSSCVVMEKCCHKPGKSMNLRSMTSIFSF